MKKTNPFKDVDPLMREALDSRACIGGENGAPAPGNQGRGASKE